MVSDRNFFLKYRCLLAYSHGQDGTTAVHEDNRKHEAENGRDCPDRITSRIRVSSPWRRRPDNIVSCLTVQTTSAAEPKRAALYVPWHGEFLQAVPHKLGTRPVSQQSSSSIFAVLRAFLTGLSAASGERLRAGRLCTSVLR